MCPSSRAAADSISWTVTIIQFAALACGRIIRG
jgi:hypothetical protein